MGSKLVSDGDLPPLLSGGGVKKDSAPVLLSDTYSELCPYYMAIGMTYEEYWNGDNAAPMYYREAHKLKRKQRNEELWLQGLYIYEAIGDLEPLFHDWVKEPPKAKKYSEEPYPLTKKEAIELMERKKRKAYEAQIESMKQWASTVNARKRGENDG